MFHPPRTVTNLAKDSSPARTLDQSPTSSHCISPSSHSPSGSSHYLRTSFVRFRIFKPRSLDSCWKNGLGSLLTGGPPVQRDAPISSPPITSMLATLQTRVIGWIVLNPALVSVTGWLFLKRDRLLTAHTPWLVESAQSTINPSQLPQLLWRLAFFVLLPSLSYRCL